MDLEQDDLVEALKVAGFDHTAPCVVTWLGVTMYLSRAAIEATLAALGRLARGSELVVEYALSEDLRDPASCECVKATTASAAEPWLSSFSPEMMANLLSTHGFQTMHQHRPADLGTQFWTRSDLLVPSDLLIVAHARIDAASRVTA